MKQTALVYPMNLLLFGGSFDPVHRGHLALAACAVLRFGMHEVIFLPAKKSPLKQHNPSATDEERLLWLQLATAGIPWAKVSSFELNSSEPSYSWKTVQWAKKTWANAQIHWLIGTDQWEQLDSWQRIDWLDEQVIWVVGARGEQATSQFSTKKTRRSLWLNDFAHPASSTELREQKQENAQINNDWLPALVAELFNSGHL